jgi:hypothetical protein
MTCGVVAALLTLTACTGGTSAGGEGSAGSGEPAISCLGQDFSYVNADGNRRVDGVSVHKAGLCLTDTDLFTGEGSRYSCAESACTWSEVFKTTGESRTFRLSRDESSPQFGILQ